MPPPRRLEMLESNFNKWGILFIMIGARFIGEREIAGFINRFI
jgi:hypothetical protein